MYKQRKEAKLFINVKKGAKNNEATFQIWATHIVSH
jgi:hypothetical protein